ncbi:hypothetical protein pipiens_007674 [Culex pipiens pipiens]|uniref:Uncharacterized protein n=1 Tax=Culex pipiens pipiens TaxID=38569 RepID=A0ABD1DKQ7_CULPP
MGCQDLLEDVPGRSRRDKDSGSSPGDLKSFVKGVTSRKEFIDDDPRHGMALQLEPQGLLFAEIKFLNPMISRKPKLQRQRMIFNKQQVKNIPRAKQMNINVATWGRLLKRNTGSSAAAGTAQPMITTPSTPSSTAAPFDTVVEHDPAETLGESADFNTIGLGGGRPLGKFPTSPCIKRISPNTSSSSSPSEESTA